MSRPGSALLDIRGLSVEFAGHRPGLFSKSAAFRALDGIDLTLHRGETLGLIGESGSGKTTLGKAIVGLVPTAQGEIVLGDSNLAKLRGRDRLPYTRRIQMVFQDPYSSLHPRQTVAQTLAEPLKIHRSVPRDRLQDRVEQLLQRVGLAANMANRFPQHFSGGQRQRIAIARAIATSPDIVIADEPVSALDVSVQAQVLNLLDDLRREQNMAMLFISHDLSIVRHLCQRIAVMYLGQIVEEAGTEALVAQPAHPYTAALLSAAPRIHARDRVKPIVLTGDVPSHAAIPAGCPFHTRCWLYQQKGRPAKCREQRPLLAALPGNRRSACFFPTEAAAQQNLPALTDRSYPE